jgi:intein/homing endonuclease
MTEWDNTEELYDEEEELGSHEAAERDFNDHPSLPSRKSVAQILEKVNADGSMKKIIRARKSDFVHNLIYLDGAKFSFAGRDYLRPVYDRNDRQILLKTARQVEKTTFLANNLTVSAVVTPYNKALYVSPSHTQTRQFSNEKLRPAIEKSPLINKYFQDTRVSTQVFEKGFTNGSYIFLRSAFRSADRCVAKGTLITLCDGSVDRVENLVGKNPLVLSTNCTEVVSSRSRQVWSNGKKEVYTVTLESGHEVTVSSNHRWVTPNNVVSTEELVGEWVPIPLNFFYDREDSSPEYTFLGYFLGDGCMAKNTNSSSYRRIFSNNNIEVIEDFRKTCTALGLTSEVSGRIQKGVTNYTVRVQERELFEQILGRFGVLGDVWHNRAIPFKVFGSRERARDVLRPMFESDGWVSYSTKNRQCEVGWVSGSLQLARGVQYCLQGLGIYATLNKKKPGKNNRNTSYNIKIRNSEYISIFRDRVGFISKEKTEKLDSLLSFAATLDPNSVTRDCPARKDINDALSARGISDHALWKEHKVSWRRNSTVNGIRVSRHKVEKIYKLTEHKPLLKYLNPNILWVSVAEVSLRGVDETFDMSVPDTETFVANGVFTHNTRGISARSLCLDEIQDFLGSEIPVIMECTSHFLDSKVMMAGTPKSFENPIENYWKSTTQNEWIVKCQSCGKQNFLDEQNIAPTEIYKKGKLPPGPVCKRCQKPIYPHLHGRWVTFKPDASIQGYRIPQLMVPWICGLDAQWEKLLWKRDNYPFGQLYNEVLGLSYDNASKPVTREELIECCRDYHLWDPANLGKSINEAKRYQLTAGVDWGEGNDGSEKSPAGKVRCASYTVLTIGAYINQKVWRTFLAKRYMGKEIDPDYIVKDIARICNALGVHLVGVDWGHGWGVNNHLIRLLGPKRVVQLQHLPKLKSKMKWDPIGFRYHLHRNFMMSELFFDIKQKFVEFPKWAEFETFAKDILGIYSEYVEYRREIKYDHSSHNPDDFFHSLLYSKLSSDIFTGKSRRFTFDIPDGIGQQGYLDSQRV